MRFYLPHNLERSWGKIDESSPDRLWQQGVNTWPLVQTWTIGHPLSGALALLLGITFGVQALTSESPGDATYRNLG